MQKSLIMIMASILAVTSISSDANARPRDREDTYRGDDRDHRGRGRGWDDRYDRNDRRDDRNDRRGWHDNGRHNGWYKNHRWYSSYHYQPYTWRTVRTYTPPVGYTYGRGYREVRCTDSYNPFGILLGGLAGAGVGSTIGHGGGRTAAIASGAVIGGLLGQNLSQRNCSSYVFRDAPVGVPYSWQAGPGEAYAVVPTRDYRDDGQYCREYQAYATVGGRRSQTYGMACMQPDGSWQVVS